MILTKGRYYTRRGGFYWTCPICGSNLDAGERCTCEDEAKEDPVRAFEQGGSAPDPEQDRGRTIQEKGLYYGKHRHKIRICYK